MTDSGIKLHQRYSDFTVNYNYGDSVIWTGVDLLPQVAQVQLRQIKCHQSLHCENDIAPISFYSKRKNVISYFTKKSKVVSNRNVWKIRFGQLKDNALNP